MSPIYLHIGGLIAMGFDSSGRYLLTVSHSGRGVYDRTTWQRVARDYELSYPEQGKVMGIGPIAGEAIEVTEKDYAKGRVRVMSSDGACELLYEDGAVAITQAEHGAS